MNRIGFYISFMVIAMMVSNMAQAELAPIYTSGKNNYGAGGYDVTSYFTQSKAVKGKADYQAEWQGAQWLFSSAENRDKFNANPEKYAPQYGGYCAWAVSNDSTAKGSPTQWTVVDDKLYLNYNAVIKGVWGRKKEQNIAKADANWPNVLN